MHRKNVTIATTGNEFLSINIFDYDNCKMDIFLTAITVQICQFMVITHNRTNSFSNQKMY